MTSINFPDLIAEKIAWYHWKHRIKAVNRQIPPPADIPSPTDVDLVCSQVTDITRRQAFTKLIQHKGNIVNAIMDLTMDIEPTSQLSYTTFPDDPPPQPPNFDDQITRVTPMFAGGLVLVWRTAASHF
jgi:hypothetical protein